MERDPVWGFVKIKHYCTVGHRAVLHGQLTSFLLINYNVYLLTPTISKPLKLRGLASRFCQGVLSFQQILLSLSEEIKGMKGMASLSGILCHTGSKRIKIIWFKRRQCPCPIKAKCKKELNFTTNNIRREE